MTIEMTARSKSMTAERTVGTAAARMLMDFALSKGCSQAELIARSGIDVADLLPDENRIPLAVYLALMNAGQELCNDPAFALHFGESDEGAEASLACMMGIFSPSTKRALEQATRDPEPIGGRLQFVREGDRLWIVAVSSDDFPQLIESSFAR